MPAFSPLITSNLCNRMVYSSDSSASSPDEQVIRSQSISSRVCVKKIKSHPISTEELAMYLATRKSPVKSGNKRRRDIASEFFDLSTTPPDSSESGNKIDARKRSKNTCQEANSNNTNVKGTSKCRVTSNESTETVMLKKRRLNFRRRLQLRSTET